MAQVLYSRKKIHVGEAGHLPETERQSIAYILRASAGKDIDIVISQHERNRTRPQEKYYRGVVLPWYLQGLINAGHIREGEITEEWVHDDLKRRKLKSQVKRKKNPVTGKYFISSPTTTTLTTWQYMDYLDSIIQEAAEFLNIPIPEPDKEWRVKAEQDYQKALSKGLITEEERNKAKIALKLLKLENGT